MMRTHLQFNRRRRGSAFTLLEIMIVVALMGMVVLTAVPCFVKVTKAEGMRRAVRDISDCCEAARIEAVSTGKPAALVIRPMTRSVSGGKKSDGLIPQDVTILSIGVNFVELGQEDEAQAKFYPTGISDEFEITLQDSHGEIRQVNLDIITGQPFTKTL